MVREFISLRVMMEVLSRRRATGVMVADRAAKGRRALMALQPFLKAAFDTVPHQALLARPRVSDSESERVSHGVLRLVVSK
jgi:hypothetical protein